MESFQDACVTLQLMNTSDEPRTIKVAMCSKMAFYTGIAVQDIKTERFNVNLSPNSGTLIFLTVILAYSFDCILCGWLH